MEQLLKYSGSLVTALLECSGIGKIYSRRMYAEVHVEKWKLRANPLVEQFEKK